MGSMPGPRGIEKLSMDTVSQNVCGFNHAKKKDLLTRLAAQNVGGLPPEDLANITGSMGKSWLRFPTQWFS
jgi:hypothetical protein